MKRKLLKSLLAMALLCVGSASAWAQDPIETVGASNLSTNYLDAHSTVKNIENGSTLHYAFTISKAIDANYKGWILWVAPAGSEVTWDIATAIVRGDNWEDKAGSNTGCISNFNWDTFNDDMNGATVDMYVSLNGTALSMRSIISSSTSAVYNYSYCKVLDNSPESLDVCLSVNAAYLEISKDEITTWATVWNSDFSSAPTGMTYSVTNGTTDLTSGYLHYDQGGGSGNRAINTAFNGSEFNVNTDWVLEFDWNSHASNQNSSSVSFATDKGTAFTITWNSNATTATIIDANSASLTTTLPILGTNNRGTASSFLHFVIVGDSNNGVYLTVTNGETVYVNNQLVSSTYGYPATFNGTLGRAYSHMYLDNIIFKTPAVAGFVATPTCVITAPDGINRKFTLDCLTDGAVIYYATSDLEKGDAGWLTYTSEVSTDAATIYTYAQKGSDTSEKTSFATGAGAAITLNAPIFSKSSYADGAYTVTIASDQSNLPFLPTNVSLRYSIDGGDEVAYSGAFTLSDGSTVSAHVESAGYANSTTTELTAYARPGFCEAWSIDFSSQASTDKGSVTVSETAFEAGGVDFGTITADNFTSNDNFGVKTSTDWLLRNTGNKGLYSFNGGSTPIGLANLKEGQYVLINCANQAVEYKGVSGGEYKSDYSTTGQLVFRVTADGNMNINLGRYIYIQSIYVFDVAVSATVSAAGYATFASDYPLDFTNTAIKAYIATAKADGSGVYFTQVNKVPANTGLLLIKEGGATESIPVFDGTDADAVTGNVFVRGTGAAVDTDDSNNYNYILNNGNSGLGFYRAAGQTVATNRAYISIAKTSPVKSFIDLSGFEATAIQGIEAETKAAEIYNLAGQRMNKAQRGINIINGKKVVVK